MEKETINRIKLGLFVSTALLVFIVAIYFIGDKKNMFSSTVRLYALFNNVNGLQPGNNVRFSGIDIGTVTSVSILNDTAVKVEMMIEEDVRKYIKKDALASIGTDGLMGNKIINLSAGSNASRSVSEGDMIAARNPLETDEMLRTLELTNENTAAITFNAKDFTHTISTGRGLLWKLLTDSLLAMQFEQAVQNINQTGSNASSISKDMQQVVHDIKKGKGTAGLLLTDTAIAGQLKRTIRTLEMAGGQVALTGTELNMMAQKANVPGSAFSKLMSDTVLAADLQNSIMQIGKGAEGFNENMEALKHTWPLKRYFKKQARAVKK